MHHFLYKLELLRLPFRRDCWKQGIFHCKFSCRHLVWRFCKSHHDVGFTLRAAEVRYQILMEAKKKTLTQNFGGQKCCSLLTYSYINLTQHNFSKNHSWLWFCTPFLPYQEWKLKAVQKVPSWSAWAEHKQGHLDSPLVSDRLPLLHSWSALHCGNSPLWLLPVSNINIDIILFILYNIN